MNNAALQYTYPNLRLGPAPLTVDGRPVVVYGPGFASAVPRNFTIPGGRIEQSFDQNTLTVTNTTLRDHVFFSGTVTRSVVRDGISIYIESRGTGTHNFTGIGFVDSALGRLNQAQGPRVFRALDQRALDYFEAQYGN